MKHRKLRIAWWVAWSVAWGVLAVLFVALWVRSYTYWDQLYIPLSPIAYTSANWNGEIINIESAPGRFVARFTDGSGDVAGHISSEISHYFSVDDFLSSVGIGDKPPNGFFGLAIYKQGGDYPTTSVPFWFLILVASVSGCLPWIRLSRRFSLRTLLIATTLIAVVLGLIVWAAK